MPKKIVILQGHPDGAHPHYCHALADAYRRGAVEAGHDVSLIDIGAVDVPVLRDPEAWKSPPDLPFVAEAQAAITAAEHMVLIYPLWMGTLPAHLKAWMERVFTEDWAFEITEHGWHPRLKGRSARVIVTMGMPAAAFRWFFFAHSLKSLKRNMLGFAGFAPVRDTVIGMVESKNAKHRAHWLGKVEDMGRRAI